MHPDPLHLVWVPTLAITTREYNTGVASLRATPSRPAALLVPAIGVQPVEVVCVREGVCEQLVALMVN
jgi:hypothetical protein